MSKPKCSGCGENFAEFCCSPPLCCICLDDDLEHRPPLIANEQYVPRPIVPPQTLAGKLDMAEKLFTAVSRVEDSYCGINSVMRGLDPPRKDAATERKGRPLARGVLDYFPDALLAVAEVSRIGNDQHNPGQPLHWAKEKSTDEADALLRHLIDRGRRDTDGARHSAKVAWRALALLQREIDAEKPNAAGVLGGVCAPSNS